MSFIQADRDLRLHLGAAASKITSHVVEKDYGRKIVSVKQQVTHEGQLYYSVPLVAKLLGTSATKVRRLMLAEGLEWMNFRENGPIYISADSYNAYRLRLKSGPPA